MKNIFYASLAITITGIILTGCEKEEEIQSLVSLNLNSQEIFFTGGEPDYGYAPFGFFNHNTPHIGTTEHILQIYAGKNNVEHYYESDYIRIFVLIGEENIEISKYPCTISFYFPDIIYSGETIAEITHFSGPTGYVQGCIEQVVLKDTSDEADSIKFTDLKFTVNLFGNSFSIE